MEDLKIALLQITPLKSLSDNLQKGIEYCEAAAKLDADIVLFPEMWSNGYNFDEGFENEAITLDSPFLL